MSVDTTDTSYDPWAGEDGAEPPAAEDAAPEFDEFDDILAGLEEEESGEAIRVPSSAKVYSNPLDVGLKHMQWVPIEILTAEVDPKCIPRLSSKTCVAELDGKKFVIFDQVEKALKAGGTEVIRDDVRLPYFKCTANHAGDEIQRRFPYEIEVPVFTIKTALFQQQNNGRTGFPNEYGRSLRLATHATEPGEKVSSANWDAIAKKMVRVVVLAQVTISQSKTARLRPVADENGQKVNVLLDPNTAAAVTVLKLEDGSGYVLDDGTGTIWDGDENLLFQVPGKENAFAIRDDSESSGPLQESYYPVNDYLKNTFLPLPERKITVGTLDGEEVEGEITLDTVGAIAKGNNLGDQVDVFLRTGRKVTAVWLGTEWSELKPNSGTTGGTDQYKADPVSSL